MAATYIANGYKLKISRHRTHITTYEDMRLQTTAPLKKDKPKKIKPSIPSNYADCNYYARKRNRRRVVKEIIYNNFALPNVVMITLTFDQKKAQQNQSYTDLSYTHYEFKKFIQRVESHYDDFRYIATFNRQSSGNWHYHLFCNFPPNIPNKTITHLWRNGITYITYIKTQADYQQCMDYLIQNMDQAANELKGKRGYLAPKDIERDKVIKSWNEQHTEEFMEAFERVENAPRTILYETRNHLGVKGKSVDETTGEIREIHLEDRELNPTLEQAGYENWETVYTHLTSSADFSDKFSELKPATPKQKKWKHNQGGKRNGTQTIQDYQEGNQ